MDAVTQALHSAVKFSEKATPEHISVPSWMENAADAVATSAGKVNVPYVDLGDSVFWQAVFVIVLQPLIWNIIGRFEHHTRILSRVFIRREIGVYVLAAWIFIAGRFRDGLIMMAMDRQEKPEFLDALGVRVAGILFVCVGLMLVMSSFFQLGVYGTFLGDYFGILMDEPITKFPFSVMSDPMYDGSTLAFLGKSLLYV